MGKDRKRTTRLTEQDYREVLLSMVKQSGTIYPSRPQDVWKFQAICNYTGSFNGISSRMRLILNRMVDEGLLKKSRSSHAYGYSKAK